MINASEIVKGWKQVGGWRVSPGLSWCKAGDRVRLGDWVTLGDGVTLGDWVRLGDGVTLGDWVTLGDGVVLGDGVRLGDWVTLGDRVTFARDLGIQSGYRHALVVQDGVVKFVGGCHTFTFDEARAYWADKPHRIETLLAVDFAERLARVIPETAAILGVQS